MTRRHHLCVFCLYCTNDTITDVGCQELIGTLPTDSVMQYQQLGGNLMLLMLLMLIRVRVFEWPLEAGSACGAGEALAAISC